MEPEQLKLMPSIPGSISFDAANVAHGFFYFVVILAIIYTLVVAYHWLRYGHRSVIAIPALAVHVFVSLGLIGFAASGL